MQPDEMDPAECVAQAPCLLVSRYHDCVVIAFDALIAPESLHAWGLAVETCKCAQSLLLKIPAMPSSDLHLVPAVNLSCGGQK